jgi:hypothetical protein
LRFGNFFIHIADRVVDILPLRCKMLGMSRKKLTTATEVIDLLGGTNATAKILKRSPQAVSNWRATNRLPPRYFLVLLRELQSRGASAPPSLWDILERVQ